MKITEIILDWLFPPKCVFCRKVLNGTDICTECEAKLPYTKGDDINQKLPHAKACISPLYYEGVAREAILRYKFWGMPVYAHRFGLILAELIEKELDCGDIDVISYVPLSRKRQRKRGYNQAELMAQVIAKKLELPCRQTLVKTVDNPAQSGTKTSAERRNNVKGVYRLHPQADISKKSVLLIDDVVTTGSTLSECAKVLNEEGALYVYCAALARRRD